MHSEVKERIIYAEHFLGVFGCGILRSSHFNPFSMDCLVNFKYIIIIDNMSLNTKQNSRSTEYTHSKCSKWMSMSSNLKKFKRRGVYGSVYENRK